MHFSNSIRTGLQILSCCLSLGVAHAQTTVPGKIPGEFSVSPSGAATYRIPIQVPPGIAGMEPKLALVYNSQAGNGIMGMGWSLEGLSAITRCPKTMATDGVRGAITHTPEDRFCMDGQRLINVAGAYGAAGSEYRTEIDSFSKVIANGAAAGNATNGPESFTVKTKAGLTLEYGSTADSRIEAQGKAVVRVWALSKMRDAKGNEITYDYTEDNANGEFNVSSIAYAGDRRVSFTYEDRPDKFAGYEAGVKISQTSRLKEIISTVAHQPVATLVPRYRALGSMPKSILESLSWCNQNSECVRSTQFLHNARFSVSGDPSLVFSSAVCGNYDSARGRCNDGDNHRYIHYPDINGDGLQDLCFRSDQSGIVCMINQGAPVYWSDAQIIYTGICGNGSTAHGTCNDADNWDYISFLDVNADGMADLVYRSDTGMRVWLSNGSGFVSAWQSSLCANYDNARGRCNDADNHRYIRYPDINGDGLPDFCFRSDQSGIVCMINQGAPVYWSDAQVIYTGICGNGSTAHGTCNDADNWDYISFLDVNADGMSDLIYRSDTGMRVWLSNGSGFVSAWQSSLCANYDNARGRCNDADNHRYIRYPDINGDGLPDFCFRSDQSGIVCMINQGAPVYWSDAQVIYTGICGNGSTAHGTCNDADNWDYISFLDVNADGMSDLIYRSDTGMRVWLSNGAGFTQGWQSRVCANGDTTRGVCNDADNHRYTSWLNIDGGSEPNFCFRSDNGLRCLGRIFNSGALQLSGINDGGFVSVKYQSLASASILGVYARDSGLDYPQISMQPASEVIVSVERLTGLQSLNRTNYSYGGLRAQHASTAHPGSGRGMLGFRWMKSREESTGLETYTEFSQQWPHTGQVLKSETRLIKDGVNQLLKRSVNTPACYQSEAPAGAAKPAATALCTPWSKERVYFPFVASSTEESWDLNGAQMPTLFSQSLYGGYADQSGTARQFGDPTQITVDISEGGVLKHRKVTTNQYRPAKTDGANWESGRLNRASVTSSQY